MLWFTIAIIAYFLFAVNTLADKLLITKAIRSPVVYAFFVGFLGLTAFVLAPFGLSWIGWWSLLVCMAAGAVFLIGALLFYQALLIAEASRVIPLVGGLAPIFTFMLAYFFLSERLVGQESLAFLVLVVGSGLLAYDKRETTGFPRKVIPIIAGAALFFAASQVLSKFIYTSHSFISGFIWIRTGSFLVALILFSHPKYRRAIISAVSGGTEAITNKIKVLYIGNQAVGASAFILLNYAIALGSVTLVNAMQGFQHAMVLVLAFILTKKFPQLLKEKMTGWPLAQKILAIGLIGFGLVLLSI